MYCGRPRKGLREVLSDRPCGTTRPTHSRFANGNEREGGRGSAHGFKRGLDAHGILCAFRSHGGCGCEPFKRALASGDSGFRTGPWSRACTQSVDQVGVLIVAALLLLSRAACQGWLGVSRGVLFRSQTGRPSRRAHYCPALVMPSLRATPLTTRQPRKPWRLESTLGLYHPVATPEVRVGLSSRSPSSTDREGV